MSRVECYRSQCFKLESSTVSNAAMSQEGGRQKSYAGFDNVRSLVTLPGRSENGDEDKDKGQEQLLRHTLQ